MLQKSSKKPLEKFVNRYDNEGYHESLNNLTPADVYFGRGEAILEEIKRKKDDFVAKKKRIPTYYFVPKF
jgi:putative transposase